MIYRGPGFLAVLSFGSSFTPSPLSLDRRHTGRLRKRDKFPVGEGGWVPMPNHRTQLSLVLYSIINSILSVCHAGRRNTKRKAREVAIMAALVDRRVGIA
jgi:hypothetical protein